MLVMHVENITIHNKKAKAQPKQKRGQINPNNPETLPYRPNIIASKLDLPTEQKTDKAVIITRSRSDITSKLDIGNRIKIHKYPVQPRTATIIFKDSKSRKLIDQTINKF